MMDQFFIWITCLGCTTRQNEFVLHDKRCNTILGVPKLNVQMKKGDTLKNLPDALKTECLKCTEKQKENAKKTLNFLLDEKPDLYKELEAKYDPEHVYRKKKEEKGKF